MSGSRRGGLPPRHFPERRTSYGTSPTSRRDRDREHRTSRDGDERESEQLWNRDKGRQNSWHRDGVRSRSRSPEHRGPGDSHRPYRHDFARPDDFLDSSTTLSRNNSPVSNTRSFIPPTKPNNNTLSANVGATETIAPPPPPQSRSPSHMPTEHQILGLESVMPAFLDFVQQLSTMAMVEVQLNTAKTLRDEREYDFAKSRTQHEKFPNVKAQQTEAKDLAEKKYQAVKTDMGQQESKVAVSFTEALKKLVPHIALMASSSKEQKLQEDREETQRHCASLEKTVQAQKATIQEYAAAIEKQAANIQEHAKYIQDLKDWNETKEQKEREMETKMNKILAYTEVIHNLQEGLVSNTGAIAEVDAKNTKQLSSVQLQVDKVKIDSENTTKRLAENEKTLEILAQTIAKGRITTENTISTIQEELLSIKNTPQPEPPQASIINDALITSYSNRIASTESSIQGLINKLNEVETVQKRAAKIAIYEQKFDALRKSTQDNVNSVESRVKTLEDSHQSTNNFKDAFKKAFSGDLNNLHVRVGKVETSQAIINETPMVSKGDVEAFESRLVNVEKAVRSTKTLRPSPDPSAMPAAMLPVFREVLSRVDQLEANSKYFTLEIGKFAATKEALLGNLAGHIAGELDKALNDEVRPEINNIKATLQKCEETGSDLVAKSQELLAREQLLKDETNEWKKNFIVVAMSKVLEAIRADPRIVSQEYVQSEMELLHTRFNDALTVTNKGVQQLQGLHAGFSNLTNSHNQLQGELLALTNVSHNHQTRMDNVTTGALASIILNEWKESPPELPLGLTARAELDVLRKEIKDLVSKIKTVSMATTTNNLSWENLVKETGSNKETAAKRFIELIEDATKLSERLDGLESEVTTLKKIPNVIPELQVIKANIVTLETGADVLRQECTTVKNEVSTLKNHTPADLLSQLDSLKQRINNLTDKQQADFTSHLSLVEGKDKESAENTVKLSKLETEFATLKQQLPSFQIEEEEFCSLKSKIDNFAHTVKAMKGDHDQIMGIKSQISEIQSQLNTMGKEKTQPPDPKTSEVAKIVNGNNGVNQNRNSPVHAPGTGPIPRNSNRRSTAAKSHDSPVISDIIQKKRNRTESGIDFKSPTTNGQNSKASQKKQKKNRASVVENDDDGMNGIRTPTIDANGNDDDEVVFLKENKAVNHPTHRLSKEKSIKQDYSEE